MLIGKKWEMLNALSIKPEGWLKEQLITQRNGLSGNLDLFWPDIKDSSWFGGEAEGWERAPYWLDGVIQLAYLLEDQELIGRVDKYMNYIIDNQQENGWLGPKIMKSQLAITDEAEHYDVWAQFLALKMIANYYEIKPNQKILDALEKGLKAVLKHIHYCPLFNWGHMRWFEALIPIYKYYEITGEEWVLELVIKLRAQGFNWDFFFENWTFTEATPRKKWNYMSHIVNNTMALKAYHLWYRFSKDEKDLNKLYLMMDNLEKYHGTVVGTYTGDECLAGTDPNQGTELCGIVEQMYSLEKCLEITGDMALADRLEVLAYNALPATFTEDMWGHQYDQQVNQIECSSTREWPWTTNNNEANIFGLEPHFGCCTSNFSQGWPNFVRSLWMKNLKDYGITALSYAPCRIKNLYKEGDVEILVESNYPFDDQIRIKIDNKSYDNFNLKLRIPELSEIKTLEIKNIENNEDVKIRYENKSIEMNIPKISIEISFSLTPEIQKIERNGKNFSIRRGALVFSQEIKSELKQINQHIPGRELPHGDWEVHPLESWNCTFNFDQTLKVKNENKAGFYKNNPPISIKIKGVEVVNWKNIEGCAVLKDDKLELGEEKEIKLIPYGCTYLRITEFPDIERY